MKTIFANLHLLLVFAVFLGDIDRVCHNGYCTVLKVQDGRVRLIDPMRSLVLGNYIQSDRHLVPPTEAPIRDLVSARRWHIVVSAFLDHGDNSEAGLRARFFAPNGIPRGAADALMALEQADVGYLFGGEDDIMAITSNEEHAYNSRTDIWLLPKQGNPRMLLSIPGVYEKFIAEAAGRVPGIIVARQTYDGVHAETKGTIREFYAWNSESGALSLQKQ